MYWRRPSPYRFAGLDTQTEEFAVARARTGFGGVLTSLPGVRYVNHPRRNWDAEYKPAQLSVAAYLGFVVPATLITSDPGAARAFADKHAPTIYKPLRLTDLRRDDLRITVAGDRVFCVRIESADRILDWRSDYGSLSYRAVEPPEGLTPRLRAYLARFGLTFGCFDFAVDATGVPYFLECNPNGQWAWLEPPTGLGITSAFADALEGRL